MSDRLTLIGKSLGFLVAFFETRRDKWVVLRFNDTNIERIRDYNTYMLEIDDGILTKLHFQGIVYDGISAVENGDQPQFEHIQVRITMSEDIMIDPNEELDCYIGIDVNEVENDLTDKDISYRIVVPGTITGFGNIEFLPNRVNLVADASHIVTKAYYG